MRNLPLICIFCLFLIVVANALIDVSHQARETSMPSFRTIHGGTAELSSSTLDSFASRFRGALIREKDNGYDGARRVWKRCALGGPRQRASIELSSWASCMTPGL
jgi:hypothetical protein